MVINANGWDIGPEVSLSWNEAEQRDELSINLNHGSNGGCSEITLGTFAVVGGGLIQV